MDNWISIEDKLPKEGGRYWCYVEYINDLGKSNFQWNCSFDPNTKLFSDNLERMNVTHWMLLPSPPNTTIK